jgi:hypothetical protein
MDYTYGGPWGTGNHGYTQWNPSGKAGGQVTFGGGSFRPMTYQQANGPQQPAQQSQPVQQGIDWGSLMGNQQPQSALPATTTIQSGISARPIYNQTQINGALSRYSSMAPKPSSGPLGGSAAQLYNQESGRARLNTDRQFSSENANALLRSQVARSQSGLGWGNLSQQQQQLASGQQLNQQQLGLALLSRILAGGF